MRTIILLTAFLALASSAATAQNAYYRVKFPDDFTVYGCGAKADTIYPVIEQYPGCSFNVGVSVKDMVFNITQGGGCKKILRTWTLIYWCDYDPNGNGPVFITNPPDTDVGPTLFGLPANMGHLQYTQVIKVQDSDAPVFADCPTDPLLFCDYTGNDPAQYNNGYQDKCEGPVNLGIKVTDDCSKADILLSYRLFLDLDGNGTMETYISSSAPNAWPIDKMVVGGDTLMATIAFPTGFGLPYGTHKIEWIANDKCGNETLCKYEFTVKDCKAPTVVCINGLSINIMQTGMISLTDLSFIKDNYDNCTPANQLKIGIRKAGTGTGFPVNSHTVTFDCSELGQQFVEIWSEDAYGNADYCLTYVTVQDNMGSCPPPNKFAAKVADDNDKPVPGVQVALQQFNNTLATYTTNADGVYEVDAAKTGCHFKLAPSMNGASAKVGINTLDALILAAHLDNMLSLASPYKLLAADVDKSGSLTANDVQQIINVLLGAQDNFPGLPTWQFAPATFAFPNPLQPWSASVPNATPTFCLSGAMPAPNADFIAYKTGDVNGSATANLHAPEVSDRQGEGQVIFYAKDVVFAPGQEVRVDINTPDLANFVGFQFTLDFDPAILSLQGVEPDLVPSECMATPGAGHVTASWHSTVMLDPTIIGKDMYARTFTLVFKALTSGTLSQVLRMTSSVTPAEIYLRNMQPVSTVLRFQPIPTGPKDRVIVLSVRPNPVVDRVTAAYYLPEAGPTVITLTDATGMVLQTVQAVRDRGYHETTLDLSSDTRPGVLFLRVEGPSGAEVRRVMKL